MNKVFQFLGKKFAGALLFAALVIVAGFRMSPAALAYVVPGLVAIFTVLAGAHATTDIMATKTVVKKTTEEESA